MAALGHLLNRTRRRPASALVISVAVLGLMAGCSSTDKAQSDQFQFVSANRGSGVIAPGSRKPAPVINGTTISGTKIVLKEFRGKVVLINFWASWCEPCRGEAPDLESIYQHNRDRGLQVLGVNIRNPDKQLPEAFIRTKHLTYPNIYDPTSKVAIQFRGFPPNAIPSSILIDRNGRVAGIYLGARTGHELQKTVDALL